MENPDFNQEPSNFEKITKIESVVDLGRLFDNDYQSLPEDKDTLMSLGHDVTVLLESLNYPVYGIDIQDLYYFICSLPKLDLNEEQVYFREETLDQLENFIQSQ